MKKVLVVAGQSPVPPSSGSTQRTNLLVRSLARRFLVDVLIVSGDPKASGLDHSIDDATLVGYVQLPRAEPVPRTWRACTLDRASRLASALTFTFGFREVPAVSRSVQEIVRQGQYEWIVARYLSSFAQCGLDAFPNVIIDVDDLPAEAFRTEVDGRASHPGEWLYNRVKIGGLQRQAARLASKCRHVWVPNPAHVQLFSNASCLPNIPFPFFPAVEGQGSLGGTAGCTVLFVGLMSYAPNQEAAKSFVARIWPAIRSKIPDARFEVIGGGCPEGLRRELEASKNVHVTGFRDDLAQSYRDCSVVVAPISSGSGTSIKVLEAMYYGRACVISHFASRGQSGFLRDGENVLIARDDREFAEGVTILLRDGKLNRSIREAAARDVRESFNFERFDRDVHDTISRLGSR